VRGSCSSACSATAAMHLLGEYVVGSGQAWGSQQQCVRRASLATVHVLQNSIGVPDCSAPPAAGSKAAAQEAAELCANSSGWCMGFCTTVLQLPGRVPCLLEAAAHPHTLLLCHLCCMMLMLLHGSFLCRCCSLCSLDEAAAV
jgi:hypothetical protein